MTNRRRKRFAAALSRRNCPRSGQLALPRVVAFSERRKMRQKVTNLAEALNDEHTRQEAPNASESSSKRFGSCR